MISRSQRGGLLAGVIVIVGILGTLTITSWQQNRRVREHFDSLFAAVQAQDLDTINTFFPEGREYQPSYQELLKKYPLRGWRIRSFTGQPWPMDNPSVYKSAVIALYYQELPEQFLKPKGLYRKVTDPEFGPCVMREVKFVYLYDPELGASSADGWFIRDPNYTNGDNWFVPYDMFGMKKAADENKKP